MTATTTLGQYLETACRRLSRAGVDAPRLSARVLVAHVLGLETCQLILHDREMLRPEHMLQADALLTRREAGEPVAYLVGTREFFGRDFRVTPQTLIPRPETEDLVETALDADLGPDVRFLDAGTGSGCIAVTLCAERPLWKGIMLDISAGALDTARENARRHNVASRLCPVQGDFAALPLRARSLDLLIANPPYVSASEYRELSPEVRQFEPRAALTPDSTGLRHLQWLIHGGSALLRPGGLLLLEHGWLQGAAVRALFDDRWNAPRTGQDLAGRDRFCLARLAKK